MSFIIVTLHLGKHILKSTDNNNYLKLIFSLVRNFWFLIFYIFENTFVARKYTYISSYASHHCYKIIDDS